MFLKVADSDSVFSLAGHPDKELASVFSELRKSAGSVSREFRVTGRIDDYQGRWPDVLRKQPVKPRRILVSSVEVME